MPKTKNVKATELMVDDHLKIADKMYRVASLTRHSERGHDSVSILMRSIEKRKSFMSLTGVQASTRFTIFNQ